MPSALRTRGFAGGGGGFLGRLVALASPKEGAFSGIVRKLFDDKELGLTTDFTDFTDGERLQWFVVGGWMIR